jgi:hypothetical protein
MHLTDQKSHRAVRRVRSRVTAVLTLAAAGTLAASTLANASTTLVKISTDPYRNTTSQHRTQVEPAAFAFGKTIVAAFQSGRFFDGGASNLGWATSTNSGATWKKGFLPKTTVFASPKGIYPRVSDPSVAYDAKHKVWIISMLGLKSTSGPVDVIASRSTNGGLVWSNPVNIDVSGAFFDKSWSSCDNTPTSPHYGNCYTEFDEFSAGQLIEVTTSHDGGKTWAAPVTVPGATGLGGLPLAQPNGHLVVPYFDNDGSVSAATSTNGGTSFGAKVTISPAQFHSNAGGLRSRVIPSADIDKRGKVYVVWNDCRFESGCAANDIVMSTSTNGTTWSAVTRIPIDAVNTEVDHFLPALGADRATSGATGILGLTYYYYPKSNCTPSTCQLDLGFVSSKDGGAQWSAKTQLAGPMMLGWLGVTNQGPMVGDYVATAMPPATTGVKAVPVVDIATAPTGSTFNEDTYAGQVAVAGT